MTAFNIIRSDAHSRFSVDDVVAAVASIEAGIAFLTKRAEENGFIVLAAEIEDGVGNVCTAKPGTMLMNIYEIVEA